MVNVSASQHVLPIALLPEDPERGSWLPTGDHLSAVGEEDAFVPTGLNCLTAR